MSKPSTFAILAPSRGDVSIAYAILLLAASLGLSSAAQAEDWRQFRGPNGDGISLETGLPIHLVPDQSVAWKIDLAGRGLSSPIIVGDRVFVTCSSGTKQERLHVFCFSANDGSKIWERQFWATGRTQTHEKITVAASTPVSDGKHIYAMFSSNDLVCLDLDGNLLWLRGLMRDYPNASNSLGMASSPVFAGDTLVVQLENDSESFAAGLDPATGLNRWKKDRPKGANWTSPQLMKDPATGKMLVALQSGKGIHAVEPATGREVWYYDEGAATIPSSVTRNGVLYVPSNGITALKPAVTGVQPEQLWRSPQLRPDTASPLALGERVFVLNGAGILSCADAKSGERLWQLRLKGPFSATGVGAGQHLYFVNEKGLVQVVDTQAKEGAVLSELDLGEIILATPSISGGAVYVRGDQHLWKLASKN